MTLLTADDVLNVKFEVSSFKEGYKQDEVDEFLDEVTTTMREFEERLGTSQESSGPSHRKAEILLTSEGVRNIRFSTTRWSGYRINLVQVLATLEALEAQVRTSAFADQPVAGAGGTYGGGTYGMSPDQTGYAPGSADAGSQYAEAIAQRDQYIAQLQQENAYLRAELEAAQRRLRTSGY